MLYAHRSRHGIWKYRRSIPQPLRLAAGQREINVSLHTRNDHEAQAAYVKVHGEAEQYLQSLSCMVANPKSATNDKQIWELGQAFLRSLKMPFVPSNELKVQERFDDGPSLFEQRLEFVEEHLGIDVDDPEERDRQIEASWKAKAILGALKKPSFCMSDALRIYFEQRNPEIASMSPGQAKRYRLDKEIAIRSLRDAIGEDKPLASITRSDARSLRDYFRNKGLAISTVNKRVGTVRTIWKVAAQDQDLRSPNPFVDQSIADPVPEREKRFPLSRDDVALLLDRRRLMKQDLATILTLLAYTGARIAEISDLSANDVVVSNSTSIPHIIIRPNRLRNLKTHGSRRSVPLLGDALRFLEARGRPKTAGDAQPVFEDYSGDNGPTNVSAALMKHLKASGIRDKKKVVHSLRHTIKQALRDVECPKDISDAIQGHSSRDISDSYGSGHSIEVMARWLKKAHERIGLP